MRIGVVQIGLCDNGAEASQNNVQVQRVCGPLGASMTRPERHQSAPPGGGEGGCCLPRTL